MGITAYIGQQGRGKTFYMLLRAIHHAMRYCKRLVTNFPLNIEFLERYAIANNLKNLHKMIVAGDIIFIPGDVEYLLSIPDSCVLLDEAAIFLGDAIQSSKLSYLISRFNQCRKRGIELFYTGQAFSRIPKILRDITTGVIYCNGTCTRDEWGTPMLYHAKFTFFEPDEFDDWFASSKKTNWLYTKNHSYHQHHFLLNSYYALFFTAYDSFIDVVADTAAPGYKCLKITPGRAKVTTTTLDPAPVTEKINKLKSFKFHPFLVNLFKVRLLRRSHKTNDYIHEKKWDAMVKERPMFLPDDPFKLKWLDKKTTTPIIYYHSVAQYAEFPKYVCAHFILTWRFSHWLPATLLPLTNLFYCKSFDFAVPTDSVFVKFAKIKM